MLRQKFKEENNSNENSLLQKKKAQIQRQMNELNDGEKNQKWKDF